MIKSIEEVEEVLKRAREKYGPKNQLSVATEELCELASELQKFMRYNTPEKAVEKTKEDVVSELADVVNVLSHVVAIYGVTAKELEVWRIAKAERLRIWLDSGKDMEFTTEYRDIRS